MPTNDRFASARQAWWMTMNGGLYSEVPVVASGYMRHRCPTGGAAGSFHFDGNDGAGDMQYVLGDFDVAVDVQCLNAAETDIPPNDGAPHAYGIALHNIASPESIAGHTSRDYYHRIISSRVSGGASAARMVSEWKRTISASSVWDTLDGQELRDAAALGGSFDDLGGRWWLRLRRVGTVVTSWDAPFNANVPSDGDWVNQDQFDMTAIRPFSLLGLVSYSSAGTAEVTGRCRAFINYGV